MEYLGAFLSLSFATKYFTPGVIWDFLMLHRPLAFLPVAHTERRRLCFWLIRWLLYIYKRQSRQSSAWNVVLSLMGDVGNWDSRGHSCVHRLLCRRLIVKRLEKNKILSFLFMRRRVLWFILQYYYRVLTLNTILFFFYGESQKNVQGEYFSYPRFLFIFYLFTLLLFGVFLITISFILRLFISLFFKTFFLSLF